MLSKEDSRRLAQLERQLRRDDPEFCARMAGGSDESAARKRPSFALIFSAVAIWIAALILGVVGWWIAAALAALWATIVATALGYRIRHHRGLG